MQLKGKTTAIILWVMMTLASVLISAWVYKLATHTPSIQESQLVKRNFDVILDGLIQQLEWVAANSDMALADLPRDVDLRLVFNQQDLLRHQTSLVAEDEIDSLLTNVISFLKVPRQVSSGITYWRDKVMLMAIHEQGDTRSVAAVFLNDWLGQLSDRLDYKLELMASPVDKNGEQQGSATIMLPSIVGKPVYVAVSPRVYPVSVPYAWWLSILISALVCGFLVWSLYYRPIWKRLNVLLTQARQITKSGNFNERVSLEGKDEIAELGVQVNAILSSLEYCYNLMAKTNLITTELLQKVEPQPSVSLDQSMNEETELKNSLDVVSRLSEAFETDALEVFVQPVFSPDRSQITGYEALARWMDPEMGMVAPAEFVSMCDKAGLLEMLTGLMLRHSLAALKALREKHGPNLVVSLNLSSSQFYSPAMMNTLGELSEEDARLLGNLEFEIRESTITHDFDRALVLINALKKKGLRVCIDDYGLSRYSLMYLQRLPVDTIKLSSVFTERLDWETQESAFIDGVARFAGGLGVRVIVKNIETDNQLETLEKGLPVEYQGVVLAPPAPLTVVLKR